MPATPRLHYAYIVAALAFVLLIAAAGVRSSPTMLIQPLQSEFHWTTATISAAIAVNLLLFGLIGPFAAGVFERFGLRRTIAGALALMAVAAAASIFMTQSWEFLLLWGGMVGVGAGSISLVAGATIVNRWFETNRGTVMGILTASNATGQLIFLPLFGLLITRAGWRAEVLFIAVVCAILSPLAFLILREYPADMKLGDARRTGGEVVPAAARPATRSSTRSSRCATDCARAISGSSPAASSSAAQVPTG